ncbi:MAG: LirA/MavJ family T4SS effector [Pseudomonadota bacterium]
MPCYADRCDQAPIADPGQWGFDRATCCEEHFRRIAGGLTENSPIADSYLEDYVKIQVLMAEKTTVMRALSELGQELSKLSERLAQPGNEKYRPKSQGDGYLKLSTALAKYEAYCWFPPSHELFIGFVPPADFNSYIARGLMPKDPGAGLAHGDFTHRLHWHVLSRVITQRFTRPKSDGWNHTPLELYSSLGQGQGLAANAWFKLLDDNSQPNFTSPDWFHKHVCNGDYGALSINVGRRYDKRKKEFEDQIDDSLQRQAQALNDKGVWGDRGDGVIKPAKAVYNAIVAEKAGAAYAARKAQKYNRVGDLPVLRRNAPQDELTLEQRLSGSRSSLKQSSKDNKEWNTFNKRLGMITRRHGGGSTNLKAML